MSKSPRAAAHSFALIGALALVSILGAPRSVRAEEGMWTFDGFPKALVAEKYGVTIDDAWLAHLRSASVRLEGGCSGSFVSNRGLVLTNHHCTDACIQGLSTAENDLIANGFVARTLAEERKCEAFLVSVLMATRDVTDTVLAASRGLVGSAANKAQDAAKTRLEENCESAAKDPRVRCEVRDFYQGGQFQLLTFRRYDDVRLAFAPELAIANFGGDPDNFNFPRFNLDMALLRVYDQGKPIVPERFLAWDLDGAQAGEPVFVSGHPGQTNRLWTVEQLRTQRDIVLPMRVMIASELRGRLVEFGKRGPEQQRTSLDALLGVENGLKVRRGQMAALLDDRVLVAKAAAEAELMRQIEASNDPAVHSALGAWDEIARAEAIHRSIYVRHRLLEQRGGFEGDLFEHARRIVRGAVERQRPNGERLREFTESALQKTELELASAAPIHAELEALRLGFSLDKLREWLGPDDPFVRSVLGNDTPDEVARAAVQGTTLALPEARLALWRGGAAAVAASNDPMIALALKVDAASRAVRERFESEVDAVQKAAAEHIARARFALLGTSVYPDANFTLRLSFGAVQGWREGEREIAPWTTFDGAFSRATGKDPFLLPPSWLAAKDRLDLATPFNLVATTDIIGGNSGSPMVGRDGKVVGLVFDGNIHATAGGLFFDERVNRTIAVHSAGILEALRKVYGADALASELVGSR